MADTPQGSQPAAMTAGGRATLWRHGDFVKLWVGQTISVLGSRFTGLAVQIIAVISLGATPAEMGILAALDTLPYLLIGLFAGVWVDRYRRRFFLIGADLGRALVLATIPAAALLGVLSIFQLYVVGFLAGCFTVFFDVAYQSYLPSLVEPEQLVEGNSKLQTSASTASVAGLSISGVLIQTIGAPAAIVIDALSYVASAACVSLIRRREEAPERSARPVLSQVWEGLGVVLGNPLLRAFAACMATSNFTSNIFFALYTLFGTRELGLGAAWLGLVYGIGAAGAPVGAVLAPWAAKRLGLGRSMLLASLVGAAEVVPAALATPALAVPLLVLSSLLGNIGWSLYFVNEVSVRQAVTPPGLRGRMNATLRFITAGMLPLGGLAGGVLGQALGLRAAIVVAAVGSLASFLWIAFSPVRELRRIPEASPPAEAAS